MTIKTGLHYDMPATDYHAAHDWLSASGIKKLIPPSTPAHLRCSLDGAEEHKPHFDLGKAAHARVLGAGDPVVVVDAADWRSKDARLARDAAYEAGKVPILAAENVVIDAMAKSLASHAVAPLLFATGEPEVSAFWIDEATKVPCRARFDWLPERSAESRRMIVPDLKTAASAAPSEFSRAAARFGYYAQQEHYRDALMALGVDADPAFLFVVIEKAEPYLVTVAQFAEPGDVQLARGAVDRARRIFAECTATGEWPGYPGGVLDLELPTYLHYDLEEFVS